MITTDGKTHIKRYLAGFVPSIAQSIAFGIGDKAEAVGDSGLQLEIDRADITLVSYDFVGNKLIFKAPVPDEFAGKIYEVGLFSMPSDTVAGEFGSRIVTTFDSPTEPWVNSTGLTPATFGASSTRVGTDSLLLSQAASGSTSWYLNEVQMDLSGYSGADKFKFAFNSTNAFTSSMTVRFATDASNYYTFTMGTPVNTAGYKFVEILKSAAAATGAPNWANITQIVVTTNSTAGGAGSIEFDAIRIEDSDTINSDYVMVSRELLAVPFVKQAGQTQEVEFALDVNV